MNDLEHRLTRHLHDTAVAAEPEPDLHAVLHASQTQRPDHRRPMSRFWLSSAAAVLVVGGVVGLFMVADSRSPATSDQPAVTPTPPPVTADPAVDAETTGPERPEVSADTADPTSFPVLDELPPGLAATAYVQRLEVGWTSAMTEALVGRRVDGVLTDAVNIRVQSEPVDPSPMQGRAPTETVVMGQPALLFDYSDSGQSPLFVVTWGGGPYFVAAGEAPLAFLDLLIPGAIEAGASSNVDGPPQLTFSTLPDGFEVIASPQPLGDQATLSAVLSIGADNYDVSVSTRNPLNHMAVGRPLRSIEVNGHPAWTFLSSAPTQDITWQVDDSTYVYLKINDGTDAAGALALATQLTFVDFETWTARYSPDISVTGTTEPGSG